MKIIVTLIVSACLISATLPAQAQEALLRSSNQKIVPAARFISKGKQVSALELAAYERMAQKSVSADAGGVEAGSGTLILATIGGLVVVGAIIVAAAKNDDKNEQ